MTLHVHPAARVDRKLPSWIAGFLEYTEHIWSTDPHRLWTAITAISGAIERKLWIRSQGSNIYPNLYVFLVGPPAVGKTRPIQMCEEIWNDALSSTHHIAPVSLTKASLMDTLSEASRTEHQLENFDMPATFNSLLVASKELGALIPNYDPDFLNALTYVYDNLKYDEKRRGNKEALIIDRPTLTLIGATTPSFLLDTLPMTAWDQGFLSRVIIVFKDFIGERKLDLMREEPPKNTPLKDALVSDMRLIATQVGKLQFTKEAASILEKWHADKDQRPAHPRLQNYNARRSIHAMKLSIIAAADRGGKIIEVSDVIAAIGWLMAAEQEMPDLFSKFKTGGDATVISETHHFGYTLQVRANGSAVPSHIIYEFLGQRVPAYRIQAIVDVMLRSGIMKAKVDHNITLFTFVPLDPGLRA